MDEDQPPLQRRPRARYWWSRRDPWPEPGRRQHWRSVTHVTFPGRTGWRSVTRDADMTLVCCPPHEYPRAPGDRRRGRLRHPSEPRRVPDGVVLVLRDWLSGCVRDEPARPGLTRGLRSLVCVSGAVRESVAGDLLNREPLHRDWWTRRAHRAAGDGAAR